MQPTQGHHINVEPPPFSGGPRWRLNLYHVVLALVVTGGFVSAYLLPNGPLLTWWLVAALGFGAYLSFADGEVAGLAWRTRRLVHLHCVLIPAALVTTQVAARRLTSATHLKFTGVLFEQADSVVIASGESGVDVLLPTVSSTQAPWRLKLTHDSAAWRFDPEPEVEQVRIADAKKTGRGIGGSFAANEYAVLNGVVLSQPNEIAIVRDQSLRVVDTLVLGSGCGTPELISRSHGRYRLVPDSANLRDRMRRLLRSGTALGTLTGQRTQTASYDRFVRVQRLAVRDRVNGVAAGWKEWLGSFLPVAHRIGPLCSPPRVLLTAAAPFRLEAGRGASQSSTALLRDSARVEVRHLGSVWRFVIAERRREATASLGLAIRFERNPRPLESPLPAGGTCADGVACGVLSLRRLPPPVAHIALEGAGLDPSRFGLLAKLRETDGGVVIILPNDSVIVERDGPEKAVPVTLAGQQPSRSAIKGRRLEPRYWVLMSASSNFADGSPVLAVGIGVALLMLAIHRILRLAPQVQLTERSPSERALALGVSALLSLLLARLIIGARVTFFPPYLAAGLETAIGMWVAIATVTFGLLSWSRWAPTALKLGYAVSQQGNLRFSTLRAAFRAARGNAPPFANRGAIVMLLLIPLALLGWVSLTAAATGIVAGLAALSSWFAIAWVTAFSGPTFHSFEHGPFEVVEYQGSATRPGWETTGGSRFGRWTDGLAEWSLILMTMLGALALWRPWIAILVGLPVATFGYWSRYRETAKTSGGRFTPLLVPIGLIGSTLGIAILRSMSENGATASFVLVLMLALVSVRIGRALAARMNDPEVEPVGLLGPGKEPATGDPPPAAAWDRRPIQAAISLLAPLALLLPIGIIDMGLLLVMIIPIGAASLIALGIHRLSPWGKAGAGAVSLAVLLTLVFKVMFPDVGDLRHDDPARRADRFQAMQRIYGFEVPFVGKSFERAAARAVATRDQETAERLLVSARPGPARDLLGPSIEQVWGSRAYSAAGLMGVGLGGAPIGGRGIAEPVSYAENSFAVYVLHEHGVLGGLAVLITYLTFGLAALLAIRNSASTPTESLRASRALFLVAALAITIPAVYVALSNVGVVPITGQNMPFLGLNAWSDVTLCAGVIGLLITGAIRTETARR